jgi:uncharacterized membrane protein HdeD (DUF308 family)
MSSIFSPRTGPYWWLLLLRGILAIIIGLIVLFSPEVALLHLVYVFSPYAIFDGITAMIFAFQERGQSMGWKWLVVEGVVSVIAGVLAFVYPGETAIVLLYIVAAWALITGSIELVAAFSMYKATAWGLALGGIIFMVLAILLFRSPIPGILSFFWIIGIYGIVFGIGIIIDALRIH